MGNCTWSTRRRLPLNERFQTEVNNIGQNTVIFDIADAWKPVSGANAQVRIEIESTSGQYLEEQSFSLSPAPQISSTITEIDKDTTPHAFTINNAAAIDSFFNAAFTAGYTDATATITISVPVTQINCSAPTGEYMNHIRSKDASGITYVDPFTVTFTASPTSDLCNEGTIVVH